MGRRGVRFLLFCIDKREESFKEEKNNQRGDFLVVAQAA